MGKREIRSKTKAELSSDITPPGNKGAKGELELLLQTSPQGFWVIDLGGLVLDANDALCRMLGYSREELLRMRIQDIEALETPDETEAHIHRLMECGSDRFQTRKRRKDGTIIDVEVNAQYVGALGNRIFAFVRDITDRKRSEDALHKRNREYDLLVSTISVGIYMLHSTPEGTFWFDYVSPKMAEMFGLEVENITADPQLAFRSIHPDERDAFVQLNRDRIRERMPFDWEGRVLVDGAVKWIRIESTPRRLENTDTAWDGVVVDVTDRKVAEERLRLSDEIIKRVNSLILVANANGRITYVSPSTKKMLGYEEAEILGDGWWLLTHEDVHEREEAKSNVARTAGGELPVTEAPYETKVRSKDGETHWILWQDAKGTQQELIGVGQEITERKRVEEELRESEEKYHAFFDNSMDAILLTSPNGAIHAANPAACRMLKRTEEEICASGRNPLVDMNDPRLQALLSERTRVGKASGEMTMLKDDGSPFPVEVSSAVFRDVQGNVRTSMIIRDVSERKKAEGELKRYQLLSEHTRDIILIVRADDGRILEANNAAVASYGYSHQELTEKFIRDLRAVETIPDLPVQLEHASNQGITFESIHRRRDGSTFPVEVSSRGVTVGNERLVMSIIRDITERKRANEKLARLAAIVESSDDIIISKTTDGIITSWNKGAEKVYGYTESEMLGQSLSVLIPTAQKDELPTILGKIQRGEHIVHYETKRKKKDGTIADISLTVSPIYDDRGMIVGASTIGHDITQNKKYAAALAESQLRYRAVVQQSSEGITIAKQDGTYVMVNPAFCGMTGYSEEELLRMRVHDLVAPNISLQLFVEVAKEHKSGTREVTLMRKDGSPFSALVTGVPLQIGEEEYVQGIIENITERKRAEHQLRRSEEKYRQLIETMPDGVYRSSHDGKFLEVNQALVNILGYNSKDELMAVDIKADLYFSHEDRDRITAMERTNKTAVYRLKRKDGSEIWVEDHGRYVEDEEGNVQYHDGVVRDVTERRQADEALRRERNLLRTLIDSLPKSVYIYVKDNQSRYVINNLSHLNSLGAHRQEDVIGKTAFDFYGSDDAEQFIADEREVILTGVPLIDKEEILLDSVDGKKRYHLTTKVPLRDSAGSVVGLVGMSSDITERKHAEEELRRERNLLRTLIDSLPKSVFVFIVDTQCRYMINNRAHLESLGVERQEDVTGKTAFNFHSDECAREYDTEEKEVMRTGKPLLDKEEIVLGKTNGKPKYYLTSKVPFRDSSGAVIGLVGMSSDITDRKLAEEQLRKLSSAVEQSPSSIVITDIKGNIEYVNPKFTNVTGYSLYEALGKNPRMLKSGETSPEEYKRLWESITAGREWRGEFHNKKKNGELFWESALISPVKNKENVTTHFVAVKEDITVRKKVDEALRHTQKLESIGTLAGGIAHDFNNLLNAIMGQSSLALGRLPKESPAGNNITKVLKAAERAADLTRQLLAYSGKGKLVTEEIDLNLLVQENFQMLEVSVPKTAQLRFDLGTPASHIMGDIGQIQQVVMNLIINAGEALGTKPGTITVHTGQVELTEEDTGFWKYTTTPLQPGRYALLRVSDTGQGMKPEVLARIFDPFFTTKFTGRGLGLAAVLGIILGHKGGLRIKTQDGAGTEFEIVFPLVDATAVHNDHEQKETKIVDGEGKTILVIDDEPSVVELLTDVFTEEKFAVLGALHPKEGIDLYRQHQSDINLVILDYSMPEMDGKKAFEELTKINSEVKVILCSGFTEEEMETAFGIVRPKAFIHKPYRPFEILERASSLVSGE